MPVVVLALWLPLIYVACAIPAVQMKTVFNPTEHMPYLGAGDNSIQGRAFLWPQGEYLVSCTGSEVDLVPATPFFREAIGYIRDLKRPQTAQKIDPAFRPMIKQSRCDAQGDFSFDNLPSGAWFILAEVKWWVGNTREGGTLMQEVTLSNLTKTTKALLTDKDQVPGATNYISELRSLFAP